MVGYGFGRPRSFCHFLQQHHPALAGIVAREIVAKAEVLEAHPQLGRRIGGREEYWQVALQVLGAKYIFQYRIADDGLSCCVSGTGAKSVSERTECRNRGIHVL
jgi:hypothetical protein